MAEILGEFTGCNQNYSINFLLFAAMHESLSGKKYMTHKRLTPMLPEFDMMIR